METRKIAARRSLAAVTAWLGASLLAACGGGGGGDSGTPPTPPVSAECALPAQKAWLRSMMADRYYWASSLPAAEPPASTDLAGYFDALRFRGDGVVPADRWSYIQDTASYDQFFGDGQTLGYGVFVNGIEQTLPLRLRFVEAQSPAARAGLKRGDTVVSVNGRPAADLVASGDFGSLSPARAGDTVTLEVDSAGTRRTLTLQAAVYTLTPVASTALLPLPGGRSAGYLLLKDFIAQAEAPLAAALASFRAAGASELVIDLRYDGGGLVSVANRLASLVVGASNAGRPFAQLSFNAAHRDQDTSFLLQADAGPAFKRVLLLTGPRTCSASELVINGLKPYTAVLTVGAGTCGKPFGFVPVDHCGNTFSAVNFEAFNALGQGRYYDGIAPTCAVADDFTGTLGSPTERLTAAALTVLGGGNCPVADERATPAALAGVRRSTVVEPGGPGRLRLR